MKPAEKEQSILFHNMLDIYFILHNKKEMNYTIITYTVIPTEVEVFSSVEFQSNRYRQMNAIHSFDFLSSLIKM